MKRHVDLLVWHKLNLSQPCALRAEGATCTLAMLSTAELAGQGEGLSHCPVCWCDPYLESCVQLGAPLEKKDIKLVLWHFFFFLIWLKQKC